MRFDKFTLKVQEAIQEAQGLASQYGHQALDVEHLFVSLLKQPEGITSEIIKKLGADPRRKNSAPIPGASKGKYSGPWSGCRRWKA